MTKIQDIGIPDIGRGILMPRMLNGETEEQYFERYKQLKRQWKYEDAMEQFKKDLHNKG